MTFFSDNDPAQVLKDLLHIGLSNHSESADLNTLSTVRSAAESLLRLTSHGSDGQSNSFAEATAPDEQPENVDKSKQHIVLLGSDTTNLYPIYGSEVEIVASRSSGMNQETQLSDKVSVSSIDKCDWKQQYYFGNLVAIHQSNSFVAYAVKEKANGIVKVLNCETAQTIVLEGFAGSAVDVSFANSQDVILATIDETGDLRVFKIVLTPSGQLLSKVLLHLQQFDVDLLDSGATDLCCRVVWCPFIPDNKDGSSDEAEDILKAEMFLAFSCNSMVRVLNVDELRILHGGKPVDIDDLKSGCCVIRSHSQPVFDMALVPDGSTLATASADGFIRFHEVDLSDCDPPKLLFEWKPHDGQPVSLIVFVDDLKNTSSDAQWWKFAITGVDQNREWKLWSCETWTCLQTLTFSPSPYVSQQFQVMPCIKARLDASATYLVLSDIMRKALYVLRIERGDTTRISSVAEFLLVQPCLGLAIEDVVAERKPVMADHLPELLNGKLEFPDQNKILSLYTVQTKSLELLKISLTTPATDVHTFPSEFQADTSAALELGLASPSVIKGISVEDGRNSLEIIPSESSSFTQVTSMDEGDHLIDVGSRARILTDSSGAAEMASRDLNQATGNRPSTELSQALAHISSIQLPVHTGFDTKSNKISNGHPDSVVSLSGEFPSYSVRSSSSEARAKEHSVSSSAGNTYRINEEEPFRFHSLLNEDGELHADSSQNFIISSYSDISVASEHRSERNERSSSEWFRSEPIFHDQAEIAQNKSLKEDVNSSLDLKDFLAETRDMKFVVESPRVHQQPSDFQPESAFQPESSKLTLSSSHTTNKSSATFVGAEDKKPSEWLEILKMLKEQRESVEQLRDSLSSQSNVTSRINDLQADVANLEKLMLSGFQDTMGHFQKDKNEFVQQITGNLEALTEQQLHQQQNTLSQIVRNCLHSELGPSIEYEMHRTVVPGISAVFDPIGKKLTEELPQKLTATDTALKDNVRLMVRSKTMTEVIGKVISNNLEAVLQTTCHDLLIPAFSRGLQNVLCQINETFQKGLNMYMQQMQIQAEKLHIQSNEAALSPVLHQLHGAVAGLVQVRESRDSLDRQLADLVELLRHRTEDLERQRREQGVALSEAVNSISDQLMVSVQDLISREMTSALKQHQESLNEKIVSTLQSRSSTPAPQLLSSLQPLRTQIVGLVQRNHMNAAFQQALSAMDLSVVMFLCDIVNPDELFSRVPFPLDQPVLLSLVQQLSADLRTQTSLKCRYLEEALLNVDQKSVMMKEHLPTILEQLCVNADVVQQAPRLDQSLRRSVKRLIMTAKCLCHSLLSSSDSVFN